MMKTFHLTLGIAAAFGLIISTDAAAQRRAGPSTPSTHVDVAMNAGGTSYSASGNGECKASSEASIHGVRASLYSIAQTTGRDGLRLTLWKPKNGSDDMVTLHLSVGDKTFEVDTVVRPASKQPRKGSARVRFESAGRGGTFSIEGVASDGTKITGTVKCSQFDEVRAEGG